MVAGLDGTLSLFAGAVVLGLVHGAEPGHGWPVAAAYALDRQRTWFHGIAASSLLGLGHLVSSIAVVVVFFLAKDYFGLTQLGWVRYVAGVLLIWLGVREYRHGHSHDHSLGGDDGSDGHGDDDGHSHDRDHGEGHLHGHGDSHDHGHADEGDHAHSDHAHADHDHTHSSGDGDGPDLSVVDHHADGHAHGLGRSIDGGHDQVHDGSHQHGHDRSHDHGPGDDHGHDNGHSHDEDHARVEDHPHDHDHPHGHSHDHGHDHGHAHVTEDDLDREGLVGIVGTAFVLGFAHEEEFEIIGLCLGSSYCLELMLVYAVAVLVALVALTALLIAGFERYEERVAGLADHLPTVSAVVLIAIGVGFIVGVV